MHAFLENTEIVVGNQEENLKVHSILKELGYSISYNPIAYKAKSVWITRDRLVDSCNGEPPYNQNYKLISYEEFLILSSHNPKTKKLRQSVRKLYGIEKTSWNT